MYRFSAHRYKSQFTLDPFVAQALLVVMVSYGRRLGNISNAETPNRFDASKNLANDVHIITVYVTTPKGRALKQYM